MVSFAALVLIFFFILNLVLWIYFLVKFSKISSTEKILKSIQTELTAMSRDVLNSTDMSLNLLADKIKEANAVSAEAEKKVAWCRKEIESQNEILKIKSDLKVKIEEEKTKGKNKKKAEGTSEEKKKIKMAETDEVFENKENQQKIPVFRYKGPLQSYTDELTRFKGSENLNNEDMTESEDPVLETVTMNLGGEEKKTDFVISDSFGHFEKSFHEKVKELFMKGFSDEQIAKELNCSVSEVLFVKGFLN